MIHKFTCPQCRRQQSIDIDMYTSDHHTINDCAVAHCQCSYCTINIKLKSTGFRQSVVHASFEGPIGF